ncbi:hypothetical protein ILUMI_15483 [Ignelater luminosus]|uniref:Major facilitator superfamily (MFS) profile domain-containing protein n=1 Tax=Ignelater luminosus TaxID=2038154 RepID=A0A8K0CNJ6_IGNLU|nr:hypothetical protein ILUMI_15483 [Ignelater luminosus]
MFGYILKRCIPYDDKNHQWPQIFVIIIATLGSFINGSIVNWTSPAIPILISNASHVEPITLEEASYFTVIPTATAAIASPILAILADGIGRQKTVMLISVSYFLSWVLIGAAETLYVFYLARLVQGVGDAACFTALPMYVCEISEPKIRGSWGNLIALSMFLGYFLLNIVGAYCDIRTMAYIFGSIILIQFFLMLVIPESPYFLIMKGREEEARSALSFLRWREDVEDEFIVLNKEVQREALESGSIKDLFTDKINLKTLIISLGLRATQPFSGLPAFTMYTQYMFMQAGSDISSSVSAIIFSGVFCLCIACFSSVVDKFGRKPLMIFSCFGCCIVLALEAIFFYINEETNLDVSHIRWFPLAGMLSYIPLCSAGLAIIPTLMLGELFPTSVKGIALCILNICFSIFMLLVTKLFQLLSSNFGMYVPFCLFSLCCFVSFIFSCYWLPETKGKTLEEIQRYLRGENVKKITDKI